MKLYTKKMTYSLLATGLLACAPVNAFFYTIEDARCKNMCEGAFVQEANDKKLTGEINQIDILPDVKGKKKKRTCICTYTGDLDLEKKKTFNKKDARKSGVQKELKEVSKHARSKKCDKTTEMCMDAKEKKKKGEKCDPSKEFCFQPDRVGGCMFIPMTHKDETASGNLKGNKQKIGKIGERIILGVSAVAFTNPITAAMAAAGAVFGGTARTIMQKKCKKQCTGYFLQEANKRGIKGKLDYGTDVRFAVAGSLRNRQCFCEYSGSFKEIPTLHMFNQRTERKHGDYIKTYRKAKKERKRKKCKPEQKMCLI